MAWAYIFRSFYYGTNRLYTMLSLLIKAMVIHGFSPDGLNMSSIQPHIKNRRKSCNGATNVRALCGIYRV